MGTIGTPWAAAAEPGAAPRRRGRGALAPLALAWALAAAAGCSSSSHGHYAEINGIRMYYELHGHGPTLVLLHGGAGSGRQFAQQVPAFEAHHRLVIPDACAQGRSTDRAGPLDYHAMAEDVVALLDRLHVRSADVMGWSDGGIVGLDLAIHHPGRVRHLVTFGANASPEGLEPGMRDWLRTADAGSFGPGARQDYEALSPEPLHYPQAMEKILDLWRTQPRFTPGELQRIRARTLIAAGERDIVRREHTLELARSIPGARVWIVPGAGHGAMIERPDLVNRTVLDFLAR